MVHQLLAAGCGSVAMIAVVTLGLVGWVCGRC